MNLNKEEKKKKGQNEKEKEKTKGGNERALCGRIFSKEKREGKIRKRK